MEPIDTPGTAAGKNALIVIDIHERAQGQLFIVVEATDLGGLGFSFAQGRQEHRGQNGDDGDDHEQFDEREPWVPGLKAAGGG